MEITAWNTLASWVRSEATSPYRYTTHFYTAWGAGCTDEIRMRLFILCDGVIKYSEVFTTTNCSARSKKWIARFHKPWLRWRVRYWLFKGADIVMILPRPASTFSSLLIQILFLHNPPPTSGPSRHCPYATWYRERGETGGSQDLADITAPSRELTVPTIPTDWHAHNTAPRETGN